MSLDKAFPNHTKEPFKYTSRRTPFYNCIAWAFDDPTRWYWPDSKNKAYWPPQIKREVNLNAFINLFKSKGYEVCNNGDLEEGYSKVAIYSHNGQPTHAAKQLEDGLWSSKLGKEEDISHTIFGMSDGEYGNVSVYMRKKKQTANQ